MQPGPHGIGGDHHDVAVGHIEGGHLLNPRAVAVADGRSRAAGAADIAGDGRGPAGSVLAEVVVGAVVDGGIGVASDGLGSTHGACVADDTTVEGFYHRRLLHHQGLTAPNR